MCYIGDAEGGHRLSPYVRAIDISSIMPSIYGLLEYWVGHPSVIEENYFNDAVTVSLGTKELPSVGYVTSTSKPSVTKFFQEALHIVRDLHNELLRKKDTCLTVLIVSSRDYKQSVAFAHLFAFITGSQNHCCCRWFVKFTALRCERYYPRRELLCHDVVPKNESMLRTCLVRWLGDEDGNEIITSESNTIHAMVSSTRGRTSGSPFCFHLDCPFSKGRLTRRVLTQRATFIAEGAKMYNTVRHMVSLKQLKFIKDSYSSSGSSKRALSPASSTAPFVYNKKRYVMYFF
jgi:hypothetical protein